jgi:GAF domain-containing protein
VLADVAETLVELAGALVDDYDVHELMDRLTTSSLALLDGAAAGLLVEDRPGRLAVLAASTLSTDGPAVVEALQDDGPGLDCLRTAETVVCPDLAEATALWPAFAPVALAAGVRSVLAVPLRHRGRCIGGLSLLDERTREFSPQEHSVLSALAGMATIGLLQHRAVHQSGEVAAQLQRALDARVLIQQACGVLSVRAAVPLDEALTRMRTQAREEGRTLLEVAEQLVRSTGS